MNRNRQTDWSNLEEVKSLAESFGPGVVVYKHPIRPLVYDIAPKAWTHEYALEWVVHETVRKGQAHG